MRHRWGIISGMIAGPLFIMVFTLEGLARPSYSALRHPVSSLAIGETGWMQSADFLAAGVLALIFASALRRYYRGPDGTTWGPIFIGAAAVLLIATGLVVTDPFSGYPPGTPGHPLTYSVHGIVHSACSTCAFVSLAAACIVFARLFLHRNERTWAIYSLASAAGFLYFFMLEVVAISQYAGFVEFGGLFQRIAIVISLSWLTLLALKILRARDSLNG